MKQVSDGFNLTYCNATVLDIKKELEIHKSVWVGFGESRFFELDRTLLERFIANLRLNDDDLIEEIF